MNKKLYLIPVLSFLTIVILLSFGVGDSAIPIHKESLSNSTLTVLGQKISYPQGDAQITSSIITMKPGTSTGWHEHENLLWAYILQGELLVDYGENGTRTYQQGDTFLEALNHTHNGHNKSWHLTKILIVSLDGT